MRDEYDFTGGKRGPVVPPSANKTRITIRLDTDILDWFKTQAHQQGGGHYQALINAALRTHLEQHETMEELLRRVIREELKPQEA